MDDLIDGTLQGWPVSIEMLRHHIGAPYYGAHCAAYSGEDDAPAPDEIVVKCHEVTDACDGLKPTAALRKAKSMGFVPDKEDG